MRRRSFDLVSGPVERRIATGLAKIGLALKIHAWREAGARAVTPTQAQILSLVGNAPEGVTVGEVASRLGVTAPTASDAVEALVRKQLLRKGRSPRDARVRSITVTPQGRRVARRIGDWTDFLVPAVEALDPDEQAIFLRALVSMIRILQDRGEIPVSRICVTCRFFRPYVHKNPARPHHCAFVDAPFGDRLLRVDCSDHQPADAGTQRRRWEQFRTGRGEAQ
ncbi:MAG: MarR family winged helix-turn-helix transcriptional regulator [Armatimonadota bacterium]|nr:MarR family winged helix-turn-helix transcriptional regulator [Armatimonadota bacterium]MDR7450965.1 MarR family winged helix-turn-helix transcriptional regulator [Armatimonadota bacterium]MDR7466014.1 MarR family winged helix-turn-helix transcriptional regulator [Armatimonadota bacterium]MDR7494079.1 MarR family winged helix-turn-helix transcriptional regulator [Armatimonadota bacterium]MDR7504054.1 MarR family winged helix-turn-helix transcriptional regulator [Armatimonadota bacterium]